MDLAEQINQQMRFALPNVNENGDIACTLVVLFSPGAGKAKTKFEHALSSRFREESALRVAELSQGPQVIGELAEDRENIMRLRYAPIAIYVVTAMGEDVSLPAFGKRRPVQVVRLYQRKEDINENEPDALLVRDSDAGIDSLIYLMYLQAFFSDIPTPIGGGVLESWATRLACDEWVRLLYFQLSADLNDVPADEAVIRKLIAEPAELSCKAFLKKLEKAPPLSQYPIDAEGLVALRKELPNYFQRLFGKGVRLQLKKVLSRLYGRMEDGRPQALCFHERFFGGQNTNRLFKRVWQSPGAWYYKIPLGQLENHLGSFLSERSAAAQEKYETIYRELQDVHLADHISIDGPKMKDILAALAPLEKRLNRLYLSYAEMWFWKEAFADAGEGYVHNRMAEAKRRIENQRKHLLNYNNKPTRRSGEQFIANWGEDISLRAGACRPMDTEWTAESLIQAIDRCPLRGVPPIYDPRLYGFLRCENRQEQARIQSGAFDTAAVDWKFISDTALRGVAAVILIARPARHLEEMGGLAYD